MKAKAAATLLLGIICPLAWTGPQPAAQAGKRLWVLKGPSEVTEYDPLTFTAKQKRSIPAQVVKGPENISINGRGQMLTVPGPEEDIPPMDPGAVNGKLWLWNGQTATFLDRGVARTASPSEGSPSLVEIAPRCFLSGDGTRLYWFANEFRKLLEGTGGPEISVTTGFRAWQTDLAGGQRLQIAALSFLPCQCETGACSETCPEAEVWVPDGGVGGFFILTRWTPGQLGATYHDSFLYRKSEGAWSARKLPQALERVLDASDGGATIVHALPDSGCCGWDNESNDTTLLSRDGRNTVLFDERERYSNPDYDMSFFTLNARLSPGASFAALAIISSAQPGSEIRLSSDGKADAKELARIRAAVDELPAVEVIRLEDPPKRSVLIPHTELAGWLSDQEVLLVETGALVALNVSTGTRRKSQIQVSSAANVFLR